MSIECLTLCVFYQPTTHRLDMIFISQVYSTKCGFFQPIARHFIYVFITSLFDCHCYSIRLLICLFGFVITITNLTNINRTRVLCRRNLMVFLLFYLWFLINCVCVVCWLLYCLFRLEPTLQPKFWGIYFLASFIMCYIFYYFVCVCVFFCLKYFN